METTGDRLKKLREARGLSQEQIAELLDVNRTTYAKWEQNASLPVRKLAQLSDFFNVSIDYIMCRPEPQFFKRKADVTDIDEIINAKVLTLNGKALALTDDEKRKLRMMMNHFIEFLYEERNGKQASV